VVKIMIVKVKLKNVAMNLVMMMTKVRLLFVQDLCPFCRKYDYLVDKFNSLVKPNDMIRRVNVNSNSTWLKNPGMMKKLSVGGGISTPLLFIGEYVNNTLVSYAEVGITSEGYVEGFLKGLAESEGARWNS